MFRGYLRWVVVSLVAIATVINYVDRNALAIMWVEIGPELGMDEFDYARLLMVFMVGYAIGQALFGKIFDLIGTRLGFVLAIVIWSVSIMLHAVTRTFGSLAAMRFTLAFGEAGNWPGATKSNAEWFPIRERALAQGVFNSGASLGAVISAPAIGLLYLQFGWKATFIIIGLFGFLWLVPWLLIFKAPPERHPWLSAEERDYILTGQRDESAPADEEQAAPGWFEMLRFRQSWSVVASRFFLDPIWWLFVSWLPIYLAATFDFDIKQIAFSAWVPYVGAMAGALFGGWLPRFLLDKGRTVNYARKMTITLGGVIMLPALLLTAAAATPLAAILLISVILFGFQTAIGNIQTLPSDFFSGKSVGSLAGVGGTAAVAGVLITTELIPRIVEASGSYAPAFIWGAALVPLAILSVWVFGGRIRPATMEN